MTQDNISVQDNPQPTKQTREFELQSFLPYQLAVLADAVSQSIAGLYHKRFNLSRAEWRILAALGDQNAMTGKQLTTHTTLDKMQVSRAVNTLTEKELVDRRENPNDRRNMILTLTEKGTDLLNDIIPLVCERETFLLGALNENEQAVFLAAADKILARAKTLAEQSD